MPPFKDEHILIIAPGSQTTLAQLGLPESYTPARLRILTRMFPADQPGRYEPLRVRKRKIRKAVSTIATKVEGEPNGTDHEMLDAGARQKPVVVEEETVFEEDHMSEEGAVYPIQNGRIVDWPCLFALLSHVEKTLGPPLHTPVLLIGEPGWTQQDKETLTQFYFEKFKMPAFTIMDSAVATAWGFNQPTATIVDIGFNKCDITAISDFGPNETGRVIGMEGCGGDAMTETLFEHLGSKGFTRDMCEQLKKSNICEILPRGTPLPNETAASIPANPAAAASTGIIAEVVQGTNSASPANGLPRGPGPGTQMDDDPDGKIENDGVLDVASIVASGKTADFLAKKEREKAERVAAKKGAADAAAAAKMTRLPNSQKAKATLYYTGRAIADELNGVSKGSVNGPAGHESGDPQARGTALNGAIKDSDDTSVFTRKEVEVGLERFRAADGGLLEVIADAIHRCILAVPEPGKRSDLWDSLIIVGNGSRVKGFKEALIATLNTKYLISPSSGTMFTSELPSNFSTPLATGANTPQPQLSLNHHAAGVNPLLLAATTASNPTLAPPGSQHQALQLQLIAQQQQRQQDVSRHGQSPSSIKTVKLPDYFPEWKDAGQEEAVFLGGQVAAKVIFIQDQGLSKAFMSRTEYNDLGPQGIHEYCM